MSAVDVGSAEPALTRSASALGRGSSSSLRGSQMLASASGGRTSSRAVIVPAKEQQAPLTSVELRARVADLQSDIEKEGRERNFFQMQGDKMMQLWGITKKEIEETKAALRLKDREIEGMEEKHQMEIKVHKQQVKHLLYVHQSDVAKMRSDGDTALKFQQQEYRDREVELKKQSKKLRDEIKEMERTQQDVVNNIRNAHDEALARMQRDYDKQLKELQQKYERKLAKARDDLEIRRKSEIFEIEERKNMHINELMQKHEKGFQEIKAYYNDILNTNVELIRSLKEQVLELKSRDGDMERQVFELRQANAALVESLKEPEVKVQQLERSLQNYDKDKSLLATTKARLSQLETNLRSLKSQHFALSEKLAQVQQERDDLYERFSQSIRDIQQIAAEKRQVLESKIEQFQEAITKKEAALTSILTAQNLDRAGAEEALQQVEAFLNEKNDVIVDLQHELSKMTKAHNDLLRVYESKLRNFGISEAQLGRKPLETTTSSGPGKQAVENM